MCFISAFFIQIFCSKKEPINWNEIASFKLYESISYEDFQKMDETELSSHMAKDIDVSLIKPQILKFEKTSDIWLWKGEKYAVAGFKNGNKLKLKISWYGGFFSIIGTKDSYTLKQTADIESWQSLLAH